MSEPLDVEALIDAARDQTRLSDLGADSWREGLDIMVGSANREAQLNELGRASFESHVVTLLANRLKVTDWLRRNPEILDRRIERPLFIVGLGRTGSTRLQYILSQDPAHRCLRRWESLRSCPPPEAPVDSDDPRIEATRQEDEALGLLLPAFKAIHHEPPDGPAECVMLFRQDFRSFDFESQWALPAWGEWFAGCDMAPAYAYHERVLQLLQWKSPGRWVLKSPVHSVGLEALIERYPDARFIMTHRDPIQVLASHFSLALTLTRMASDADHRAYLIERWRRTCRSVLDRIMDFRERHPERDRDFYDLHYTELVGDPVGSVRGIYAHFGLAMDPAVERSLGEYAQAHPQGEFGRHSYSAEEFGIDRAQERERFARYIERYGVATAV